MWESKKKGLGKRAQCTRTRVLLGSPLPCTSCLCFPCSASLKTAKVSGCAHWMLRNATGWRESSPAVIWCWSSKNDSIGHRWIAGRHSVWSIGKKFLQNLFDSSRGQGFAWQSNSSNVCTDHIPYHVFDSKGHGPWFSDNQLRISTHDGPKHQVCISISNEMQCT